MPRISLSLPLFVPFLHHFGLELLYFVAEVVGGLVVLDHILLDHNVHQTNMEPEVLTAGLDSLGTLGTEFLDLLKGNRLTLYFYRIENVLEDLLWR